MSEHKILTKPRPRFLVCWLIYSECRQYFLWPYSGPLFSHLCSDSQILLLFQSSFLAGIGLVTVTNLPQWNKHWQRILNVNRDFSLRLPHYTAPLLPHYLIHHLRLFTFQTEGCDGILGSSSVIDKCGVCGGKDVSCRKVTGSFQNVTVPLGYHKILDIPPGATFVNITEKRASPNYLGKTL